MTQEEKQILLTDLCSRLPYGVKIYHNLSETPITFNSGHLNQIGVYNIKPYLRPMSSITEEEEKELQEIHHDFKADRRWNIYGCSRADDGGVDIVKMSDIITYLNSHHFDYHGLIEYGLALKAPEDMYK